MHICAYNEQFLILYRKGFNLQGIIALFITQFIADRDMTENWIWTGGGLLGVCPKLHRSFQAGCAPVKAPYYLPEDQKPNRN